MRADWGIGSAALTSVFFDAEVSPDAWWHRFQREAVSPDDAAAMWEANGRIDVRHLLPRIECPTLVIHGRNDRAIPFERGRELSGGIRGARFISDDGGHVPRDFGSRRDAAILQFLLEDDYFAARRHAESAGHPAPSGTAVILFTDIADSTALTERMGDAAFRARSRALDERLRALIREHAGTPVEGKVLGDGVMAVFASAAQAIAAALACDAASREGELRLHLGIHAGDVSREGTNVYGGAVNIAARVAGEAAAGELLVSETVRALARTSAAVVFEDRGQHALKGIGEPHRLYAVRRGDGA